MRLTQQAKPFDHPEWLFEVKFDGFRALAYIDGQCELVSRKGITYKRFQKLREQMKLLSLALMHAGAPAVRTGLLIYPDLR